MEKCCLHALVSKKQVDRLAVLVSGDGTMKLLGVPQLRNGTGQAEATAGLYKATAVFSLIQEWDLAGRVKFMCFDTTTSNTGAQARACVLLERSLAEI